MYLVSFVNFLQFLFFFTFLLFAILRLGLRCEITSRFVRFVIKSDTTLDRFSTLGLYKISSEIFAPDKFVLSYRSVEI